MADKAKRTVLTPSERVAKIEGDLAAAKAKAAKAEAKASDKLLERRSVLTDRVNKILDEIESVDAQLAELGMAVTAITDRVIPLEPANEETFV